MMAIFHKAGEFPRPSGGTAKLFMHGRSQAVRLPKAFRLPGREVRVSRVGDGVLLQPLASTREEMKAVFAALDRYRDEPFMPEGRSQPPTPPSPIDLDVDPAK